MKNVKAMFGAITLGLILSSAATAGDVSTPGFTSPPPPPLQEREVEATAVSSEGFAIDLLIAALGAFY